MKNRHFVLGLILAGLASWFSGCSGGGGGGFNGTVVQDPGACPSGSLTKLPAECCDASGTRTKFEGSCASVDGADLPPIISSQTGAAGAAGSGYTANQAASDLVSVAGDTQTGGLHPSYSAASSGGSSTPSSPLSLDQRLHGSGGSAGSGTAGPAAARDSGQAVRQAGLSAISPLGDSANSRSTRVSSTSTQVAAASPPELAPGNDSTNGSPEDATGGDSDEFSKGPAYAAAKAGLGGSGGFGRISFGGSDSGDNVGRDGGAVESQSFGKTSDGTSVLLDADPEDYFTRARIEDSIFKIVERRYRTKAQHWAVVPFEALSKQR
ncbi:MAG: hypothetical protein A2428_14460 [Bdellovibrionales bacterium RIFOXYC1_FULL_54_43]|nr:MAG: hypothetical protein A2428_14460 [Bdellovibrionales bacterium RIFOXYC1_FULL_54_43]OFZ78336.1 MAG: hypothetical protein A2603_12420 [Bdellovibrionales bacterium RIFOXYD1_FULL_55_31]